jgi:predicted dehydrogenase
MIIFLFLKVEKKSKNNGFLIKMKEIKVGMLGYSFMGRAHSNAFNQMPKFFYPPPAMPIKEVVCGRNKTKVEDFAKQFGWNRVETNWKNMIKKGEIELIR